MLDLAWDNPRTNITSFVAWGGVGKTALVNVWLNQMAQSQYHGAERVYGYSFYSQGAAEGKQASADLFIATALAWFGDPEPDKGSPWDKGERLAELIKRQRTLLILDGLEPLQYPPGELEGRLKDPGLQCLLRELARHNPGLCIVTTRLLVDDLKDFVASSVEQIELEHLSPEAGARYLKHLGVKGTNDELMQAASEFDGHALALTLLGRYLDVVYHSDIRQRDKIAQLTKEKKQGGHARRVMESYERWFQGKPELNILYMMGLFDRPAEGGAIEVLKAKPAIEALTEALQELSHEDWQYALNNLREARLLAKEDPQNSNTLDCHPLVREHFGEKLKESNPTAWKEAHGRLYEYYKTQPKEYPNSIEEMTPLFVAVFHGCQASLHQETYTEVYLKRILRGNEFFSTDKLGAIPSDLAALSNFFKSPWSIPVATLSETEKAEILTTAGFRLRALGRLAEAAEPLKTSLNLGIAHKDWKNSAARASVLSELYRNFGSLANALHCARQSVDFADRSGDAFEQILRRTLLGNTLHYLGCLSDAEGIFQDAEEMQKEKQPKYQYPILYSYAGSRYCDLLLLQGRYQEVQKRASQTLEWAKQNGAPLWDVALHHLDLGWAYLLQSKNERTYDFTEATYHLCSAVNGQRQAGIQHELSRSLLAPTELSRLRGEFDRAHRDLDEVFSIALRGNMGLHVANCHLECAWLHLAMGEKDKARASLAKAEKMIAEMGYHRRDPEIHLIHSQLALASGEKDMTRESLAKAKELIDKMGMHRWDWEVKEIEAQLS